MIRSRLRRIVAWLHRWLARDQFDEVREFVYLDEISVRSLLASTGEGGVPTETVEQDVRTTRKKRGGSAGVSAGPTKIGAKGGTEREVQTSVEERRNYDLTQSKFTRLYNSDEVNTKLALSQIPDGTTETVFSGLTIDDLERGDIIEVRVDISANLLFRLYQMMEYFGDALEGELDREAEENLRLIELSLGDSIPIVGTAIDYRVVETDGEKTIEPALTVNEEEVDQVYDLEIVTLLNIDDLWADPIHTLFNEDEFVMYCRVEDIDIDTWHPLKVTRAIGSLSQNAADELNQEIVRGLEAMRTQLSEMKGLEDWSVDSMTGLAQDIAGYSERLEDEYDVKISDDDQRQLIQEARRNADTSYEDSTTAQRKAVLNAYTDAFEEKFGLDLIDPDERRRLRPGTYAADSLVTESSSDEDDVFRIEAKTVALYW